MEKYILYLQSKKDFFVLFTIISNSTCFVIKLAPTLYACFNLGNRQIQEHIRPASKVSLGNKNRILSCLE